MKRPDVLDLGCEYSLMGLSMGFSFFFLNTLSRMQDDKDQEMGGVGREGEQ